MTYFWLTENFIKEYARHYRADKTTLDDFFQQFRQVIEGDLAVNTLEERMEDYDRYGSWDDDAGA